MPKYINADEVAKTLDALAENLYGEQLDYSAKAIWAIVEKVNEMPESIVRCKDCKHYKCDIFFSIQDWNCDNDNGLAKCNPTDFCSYGERRESE